MYVWSYMILCMGMSCLPNQTVRSWAYGNTLDPSQSFGLLNTPHSFISPWFTKYCLRYWRRARETKMKKKNKNKQQSIFLALLAEWTITVLLVQWGVSRHARGEILINQAYFRWEFGGNVIPRMFHGITKSSQTNDCYEMEPQKRQGYPGPPGETSLNPGSTTLVPDFHCLYSRVIQSVFWTTEMKHNFCTCITNKRCCKLTFRNP